MTHAEPAPTHPPPDSGAGWRGQGTVLVADDERLLVLSTSLALRQFGFSVITAESGREAIARFQETESAVRCVVLDLELPDVSGVDVLQAIRRVRPEVPVLVSTGHSPREAARCLTAGEPTAFLQKPYETHDLQRKLRDLLGE